MFVHARSAHARKGTSCSHLIARFCLPDIQLPPQVHFQSHFRSTLSVLKIKMIEKTCHAQKQKMSKAQRDTNKKSEKNLGMRNGNIKL